MIRKVLIAFAFLAASAEESLAQCAMCKTTIVNNVSHGELALAEGLNFGIMYLFATPYVVIGTIAAVWIYKRKTHAKKSR